MTTKTDITLAALALAVVLTAAALHTTYGHPMFLAAGLIAALALSRIVFPPRRTTRGRHRQLFEIRETDRA